MSCNVPRTRLRWGFLLLALTSVIFVAFASACGGDDDDGENSLPTATKPADGDGATTKATPETGGDNGGEGGDAREELRKLASEYEAFEGYVKYTTSGFGDGGPSSMAIYQKGPNSRIDIESSDGDVILIQNPDGTFMCTVAESQCIKYAAGEDAESLVGGLTSFLDPGTIEDTFDLPDGVDFDTSKEKIAGIEAICFSASGDLEPDTPGDESGEVCFSEGGLLLRIKFESSVESGSFEATEASSDVPDDAFEIPFDVIDLSDLSDLGQ